MVLDESPNRRHLALFVMSDGARDESPEVARTVAIKLLDLETGVASEPSGAVTFTAPANTNIREAAQRWYQSNCSWQPRDATGLNCAR